MTLNIADDKTNYQNHKIHTIRMIYMIVEIRCSIFKKKIFFSIFTFSKQSYSGIFDFWLKHPKTTKVIKKTAKIINLSYYLSHFIKNNPLLDIDLFSRTFDLESPDSHNS